MAKGKKGNNNGGSDKLSEKGGWTHLVYVRKYDKIMHTLRRIDALTTDDTRGSEQEGKEDNISSFSTRKTGRDPKHWDPGEIKKGEGK